MSRLNEGWLRHIPLPVPRDYVEGLDRQRQIMESQHPVFLDGAWSTEGFPQYYLMTLLWKLPHALQGLLLLAVLWVLRPKREPPLWRTQLFLAFPVVVLLAVASSSGMQLGLRYILPMFPFVLLAAAQTARWCSWRKYRWRTVLVALLIAVWPLSLRYHPRHLAYFNEAAGGPVEGRWHLLDSNLDWGQDLRELKAWLDSRPQPVADLGLAYFGTMPPEALGIVYEIPPSHQPAPGWYAVSVNFVMGRPHQLRTPEGTFRSVGLDEFGYFRFFEPRARIGSSIDVYHLTPADVSRWQYAMMQLQQSGG
ncbi:MAG: hypothetical protein KDA79_12330 [Planctomycetaceae bacterium]|nr:hypothetical protein [Planctomycetaceae bacterium]